MDIPASYHRQKPPVADRDFWIDPDPAPSQGLLLSDRILFYCQRVNLIFPFDEAFIEPASYTLHAGRDYIITTQPGHIDVRDLEAEGKVTIPPNGLIYIRFYEEVNIPHYMIARFNLRVTQVYRGLLLGTGPQVDPGFRGYLGCPIHNFTDADKTIKCFDPLITIDFQKTTPLGEQHFANNRPDALTERDYLAMRSGAIAVLGLQGLQCKIFNKRANAPFGSYLPPGESVRSSVHALHENVRRLQEEITRQARRIALHRRIGIGSLIGLLVAVLGLLVPFYVNLKDDISNRYMNLKNDIVELTRSVGRFEGTMEGARRAPTPPKGAPAEQKRLPTEEKKRPGDPGSKGGS